MCVRCWFIVMFGLIVWDMNISKTQCSVHYIHVSLTNWNEHERKDILLKINCSSVCLCACVICCSFFSHFVEFCVVREKRRTLSASVYYICRAVLYLIGWSELTPLTLRWPYLFSYWNQQCEESTRATISQTTLNWDRENCEYTNKEKQNKKKIK